jgi:hypothetical protein
VRRDPSNGTLQGNFPFLLECGDARVEFLIDHPLDVLGSLRPGDGRLYVVLRPAEGAGFELGSSVLMREPTRTPATYD